MRRAGLVLLTAAVLAWSACAPASAAEPWVEDARRAPEVSPPFQKTLYAGELLRIRLMRDRALILSFAEGTRGGLAVYAPVDNGNQLQDKKPIQDQQAVITHTPTEADYIAFRVVTGIVVLEGDSAPMMERILREGDEVSFPVRANDEIRGRFVNDTDYRSIVVYEFRKNGEDSSKASERDRTIVMDFRNTFREKLWSADADEMIVRVERGQIKFKVGQNIGIPPGH